jgi:hypothetical protein
LKRNPFKKEREKEGTRGFLFRGGPKKKNKTRNAQPRLMPVLNRQSPSPKLTDMLKYRTKMSDMTQTMSGILSRVGSSDEKTKTSMYLPRFGVVQA